ncbi:MAG: hypothetical protein K2W96_28690 [Gemmataceae bacterium]|nr:hypothetical protein [Gemmataceae bacterium]
MRSRPLASLTVFVAAFLSMGAKHATRNFVVEAPTEALAERMGQWAEYYRKTKAVEWLGKEMPPWPRRCPLRIKVTFGPSGGATSFNFFPEGYLPMDMEVEGKMDRIVASVLPHEVTHTVMAHYFKQPVPRWADEGGSVLSEDEAERQQHEGEVRRIIRNSRRKIQLRTLFGLKKYPDDMIVLYAEGYSATNLLVGKSSRAAFLAFVADGMKHGWDKALQSHYGYRSVEEFEGEWLATLAKPPQKDTGLVADRRSGEVTTAASRVVVRQTLPPALPVLGAPRMAGGGTVRGSMPEEKPAAKREEDARPMPSVRVGRPRPSSPVGFSE